MTRSALLGVSMALALGCGKPPRPPHPPPDPHLDIVLEGHTLRINDTELNTNISRPNDYINALEQPPTTNNPYPGHGKGGNRIIWKPLGLDLIFNSYKLEALRIHFQPYGISKDEEIQAFKGRFIVNGAWIHPSMRFFDFQEELGYPCNRGNQGVGKFARSPFANSWACDVGGTNVTYWMKYWANETPPLAAFDVELHDKQHPPQEPKPPPLEDILEPWLEGLYESAKDSVLNALKSVFN